MLFRQYFEPETCTYSYLLGCVRTQRAVLIDPVLSEVSRYVEELRQHALDLRFTLETHVHADHITGSGWLRENLGSKSLVHRDAGAMCADVLVTDGVRWQVGDLEIEVLHTPGHTQGCVSYRLSDRVFTGDSLLIGGCGRTDFQQGDAGTLYDSIQRKLFTLPAETLVYPGHDYKGDTVSSIGQEIGKNSRLGGGRTREDFIALMQDLRLDYPRHIDQAVPANQACGTANVGSKDS